jgi:hypothetical protein
MGLGVVSSLRRGDAERGQMAAEKAAQEGSGALYPRDGLGARCTSSETIG